MTPLDFLDLDKYICLTHILIIIFNNNNNNLKF